MTLPSMYRLNPAQSFDKKIDIILAGRKNPVLWNFLKQYEAAHPDVEYLHQIRKDGELYYESNKKGIVGKFHTRREYMNLLKTAKVAFYATPGMDGGERRTGGFNPVTPRLFELLSGGCHIIARYPKTVETDYYRLDEICPSITTYPAFESQLSNALKSSPPTEANQGKGRRHSDIQVHHIGFENTSSENQQLQICYLCNGRPLAQCTSSHHRAPFFNR